MSDTWNEDTEDTDGDRLVETPDSLRDEDPETPARRPRRRCRGPAARRREVRHDARRGRAGRVAGPAAGRGGPRRRRARPGRRRRRRRPGALRRRTATRPTTPSWPTRTATRTRPTTSSATTASAGWWRRTRARTATRRRTRWPATSAATAVTSPPRRPRCTSTPDAESDRASRRRPPWRPQLRLRTSPSMRHPLAAAADLEGHGRLLPADTAGSMSTWLACFGPARFTVPIRLPSSRTAPCRTLRQVAGDDADPLEPRPGPGQRRALASWSWVGVAEVAVLAGAGGPAGRRAEAAVVERA